MSEHQPSETPDPPESDDWVQPFDPNDTDQAPDDDALTEGAETDVAPDDEQEEPADG